ncbi:MAG: DegT/DnrJ/EryC1/StrS family aminotransferase, partial [Candidatus Omnitrophota bacterium]
MKKIPLVDLKAQYQSLEGEIQRSLRNVFRGMNLFLGKENEAFEKEFAAFCGVPYAASVASGTEALAFTLQALGVSRGDEVITVPFTFIATVEAILQLGAKPVFVDVEPGCLNMDVSQVKKKIRRKTKVIFPVHLYGHPCDMKPLLWLSRQYGIPIVEDACQAHGAMADGRKVGSLGKAGCFSFYFSKNLGAYGEGGMVVTRDRKLLEKLHLLRNHGRLTKDVHIISGYNGRMDEVQAAILRVKLKRLERWNEARRRLAAHYQEGLAGLSLRLPEEEPFAYHVYHLYVIRTSQRDALRAFLLKKGIETGISYRIPVHLQKALSAFRFRRGDFPVTEKAANEVLSLPVYP